MKHENKNPKHTTLRKRKFLLHIWVTDIPKGTNKRILPPILIIASLEKRNLMVSNTLRFTPPDPPPIPNEGWLNNV